MYFLFVLIWKRSPGNWSENSIQNYYLPCIGSSDDIPARKILPFLAHPLTSAGWTVSRREQDALWKIWCGRQEGGGHELILFRHHWTLCRYGEGFATFDGIDRSALGPSMWNNSVNYQWHDNQLLYLYYKRDLLYCENSRAPSPSRTQLRYAHFECSIFPRWRWNLHMCIVSEWRPKLYSCRRAYWFFSLSVTVIVCKSSLV